ncbi:hypothetical protein [Laceyella putida]|uniref:Uncharacterized protein n=1 Tax=Laceyella putida TaxID=110101 RepID=A0ABW2RLY5_9BACL
MFIEFHDVIPMLVSISVILTVLCSFTLIRAARERLSRFVSFTKPSRTDETEHIQHWIARRVQRREAPEDDSDHIPPVLSMTLHEKRGGKPWENHLYSLSFNDTATF